MLFQLLLTMTYFLPLVSASKLKPRMWMSRNPACDPVHGAFDDNMAASTFFFVHLHISCENRFINFDWSVKIFRKEQTKSKQKSICRMRLRFSHFVLDICKFPFIAKECEDEMINLIVRKC